MTKKEPIVPNTPLVKEALAELDKLIEEDVPRCDEMYFRDNILPLLLSNETRPSLEPWLRVCDNVKRPLDVYRGSQFLFRCPPIGRRFYFTPPSNRADTMFEHVAKALQKDDVVPTMGQRYINNTVKAKTKLLSLNEEDKAAWRVVLRHFGVIKDKSGQTDPKTTGVSRPQSDGDFIDDFELA